MLGWRHASFGQFLDNDGDKTVRAPMLEGLCAKGGGSGGRVSIQLQSKASRVEKGMGEVTLGFRIANGNEVFRKRV